MSGTGAGKAYDAPLGLDSDSLILEAIAGLCARGGIPPDKVPYFQEKVRPLIASAVEFLMETTPLEPAGSLFAWLARGCDGLSNFCVPPDIYATIASIIGGGSYSTSTLDTPNKSCLRKGTVFTAAGTLMDENEIRKLGSVDLSEEAKLTYIMQVPIFRNLPSADLEDLAKAFDSITLLEGEEVGPHNNSRNPGMYIVVQGQAKRMVYNEVATLSPGDSVGEEELLKGMHLHEALEAVDGPATLLHLEPLVFKALGMQKKIRALQRKKGNNRLRQETRVNGRRISAVNSETRATTDDEFAAIAQAIKGNTNIGEVLDLNPEQVKYIAQDAYRKDWEAGEVVFEKGQLGHRFYMITTGIFKVTDLNVANRDGDAEYVLLGAGQTFGELALLHNAPRTATVTCERAGTAWVISRNTLRMCKQLQMETRIQEYSALLATVEVFKQLDKARLCSMCDALEERSFIRGEYVLREGGCVSCLSLILAGSCVALAGGIEEGPLGRGSYFGEQIFSEGIVTAPVTIRVKSEKCIILALTLPAYRNQMSMAAGDGEVFAPKNMYGIDRSKLQRVGLLGTGSFGVVSLEKHCDTGVLYALKSISKGLIMKNHLENVVVNEKHCSDLVDSPFVVKLLGAYRDQRNVYFLLEPCFGGELFDLFQGMGGAEDDLCGSEEHVRFFVACVSLGLDHMHSHRIIYRDLKLENCLLFNNGYIKLTDMGVAKVCVGKTYTVCGTTDYFAPEVLRQTGHNRAVDWWALGVMIYIMMVGRPPFDAPDTMKMYRKIIKGFAKVIFPEDFPDNCQSMLKALCQRNPEERLTMGSLGVQNFKDHPWYRGFVWPALEARTMPAPYVPNVREEEVVERARKKDLEHPEQTSSLEPEQALSSEGGLGPMWDDAFDMSLHPSGERFN